MHLTKTIFRKRRQLISINRPLRLYLRFRLLTYFCLNLLRQRPLARPPLKLDKLLLQLPRAVTRFQKCLAFQLIQLSELRA